MPAAKITPMPASKTAVPTPEGTPARTAEFDLRVLEFNNVFKTGKSCPFVIVPARAEGTRLEECNFPDKNDDEKMGAPPPRLDAHGLPNKTTIQIDPSAGSVVRLRFRITDGGGKYARWYPIGIALSRADGTYPLGAPITTGNRPPGAKPQKSNPKAPDEVDESPFTDLRLNHDGPNVLEFNVRRMKVYSKAESRHGRTHTTYRFAVFIQNLDTAQVGVIDPEVENPY